MYKMISSFVLAKNFGINDLHNQLILQENFVQLQIVQEWFVLSAYLLCRNSVCSWSIVQESCAIYADSAGIICVQLTTIVCAI